MKKLIATAALIFVVPDLGVAQDADHQYHGQGYIFFTMGASAAYGEQFVDGGGFGGEGFLYKGLGLGFELGFAHNEHGGTTAVPSMDVSYHFYGNRARARFDPFVLGGISGEFPTIDQGRGAPAANIGGGVNLWLQNHAALRLEFREHVSRYGGGDLGPSYLAFRVGIWFR